jgi:hypothetical protein
MLIINVGRIDRTWIRGKMASPDAYLCSPSAFLKKSISFLRQRSLFQFDEAARNLGNRDR